MEQKAREARNAAKRRDHVHIPGDKHDGGYGMGFSSTRGSDRSTDSGGSIEGASQSPLRESGGSVAGSGAATGVPSMAIGRVGGKPRLAVVLFGPTGRTLGNSSKVALEVELLFVPIVNKHLFIWFFLRYSEFPLFSNLLTHQVLECSPRGKASQLMAAASQKEHFLDPLASGEMPPAAVSRLRATHTVAGSLSTANVRSSSTSSSQRYPHLYHHHRGGKNPSLISAPSRRALQATSFSSSFHTQKQQQQPGGESDQDRNSTRHFINRRLATNSAAGFDIDVYLASSPACGSDWEETLKRAYAPYLKQVLL